MSKEIKVDMTKFNASPTMIDYISRIENQSIKETLQDIESGDLLVLDNKLAFAMIMHYDRPIDIGLFVENNIGESDKDIMSKAIMFLDTVILKEGKRAYTYTDTDGTRYYIKKKGV